jgi:hypothetical protein
MTQSIKITGCTTHVKFKIYVMKSLWTSMFRRKNNFVLALLRTNLMVDFKWAVHFKGGTFE